MVPVDDKDLWPVSAGGQLTWLEILTDFARIQEDAFAIDEDGVFVPGHDVLQSFTLVRSDPLLGLKGKSPCRCLNSEARQRNCATKLQDTLHLD